MTDQAMSHDLTSVARQAFDEEINVTKDLTKTSETPFARMSMTVTFACQSFQKTKTSRLVAFPGGDPTKPMCNACYGTRMSGSMDWKGDSHDLLALYVCLTCLQTLRCWTRSLVGVVWARMLRLCWLQIMNEHVIIICALLLRPSLWYVCFYIIHPVFGKTVCLEPY